MTSVLGELGEKRWSHLWPSTEQDWGSIESVGDEDLRFYVSECMSRPPIEWTA